MDTYKNPLPQPPHLHRYGFYGLQQLFPQRMARGECLDRSGSRLPFSEFSGSGCCSRARSSLLSRCSSSRMPPTYIQLPPYSTPNISSKSPRKLHDLTRKLLQIPPLLTFPTSRAFYHDTRLQLTMERTSVPAVPHRFRPHHQYLHLRLQHHRLPSGARYRRNLTIMGRRSGIIPRQNLFPSR